MSKTVQVATMKLTINEGLLQGVLRSLIDVLLVVPVAQTDMLVTCGI